MNMPGNDFRTLQIEIVRMRIAFRQCVMRLLKNHGVGISYEMVQVMSSLWREHGVSQQVLAERTAKGKATLSSLMNNLERKGYIYRREDPADRRNKLVFMTPEGEAFWHRILPLLNEQYARLEQHLGLQRIQRMTRELMEIEDALQKA